jgi:hypothetical protein
VAIVNENCSLTINLFCKKIHTFCLTLKRICLKHKNFFNTTINFFSHNYEIVSMREKIFFSVIAVAILLFVIPVSSEQEITCGLEAGPDINFGTVQAGEISVEHSTTVKNTGNTETTLMEISGTDWTSQNSFFSASFTHYSETSGLSYTAMNDLPKSPSTEPLSNIGGGGSLVIYFRLQVPIGQSAGDYLQTITFDSEC